MPASHKNGGLPTQSGCFGAEGVFAVSAESDIFEAVDSTVAAIGAFAVSTEPFLAGDSLGEAPFFKESFAGAGCSGAVLAWKDASDATFVESSGVMPIWGFPSFILSVIAFANVCPMEFIINDDPEIVTCPRS